MNNSFKKNQRGVTLLLAILVLSAIMSISFSLATILFVEVRSSTDLLKTEPAYFGANGIAEEAIFNLKRNVCTNCSYSNAYTNNVTLPISPTVNSITNPITQDKIPPGTSFTSAKVYSLYNPSASNPSTAGSGYGRITVTYLDTGNTNPLTVYLCEFNPSEGVDPNGSLNTYNTTACSSPSNTVAGYSDSYWLLPNSNNYQMTPGGVNETHSWDLDPTKQQQLILFNSATSGTNIFVKIETFGASPTYTPQGMPYSGITAVDVTAANGAVTRKMRVLVPNTASIVAATPVFIVNSGGPSYTDSLSRSWSADTGYSGGNTYATGNSISGTSDPTLYQTERYGSFSYTASGLTPSGNYNVILKFAEIYHGGPGLRVFNVLINGVTVLNNFDIYADAGTNFKADDKTFSVQANGSGQIVIQFNSVVDQAKISAIEIDAR